MNFLQRAFNYVIRKPTKSLLLAVTFFVIGNLVILGLGISQAADNAKILTRKKMRAIVSYEVDYNKYWNYIESLEDSDAQDAAYKNYPKIDKETAINIAKDERVRAFNYMTNNTVYGLDIEHNPLGNEDNRNGNTYTDENGNEVEYKEPSFMVYANLFPNMIELEEGTFEIKDGRWYSQEDIDSAKRVVCITEEVADLNSLRAGDTITISQISPAQKKDLIDAGLSEDDINLELEIIGIYSTKEDVDPNSDNFKWMSPYESPKNRLMIPLTTYAEYAFEVSVAQRKAHPDWFSSGTDEEQIRSELETPSKVVYLLDDPLNVDAFVDENQSKCAEYTRLNANNDAFKKMARPLDTMSFFASIVVWIVVLNAVVIISLVTALTLKTREFEIGVLLSIGVSKLKIVAQLFVELIVLAFIGFGFASISGSLMAGRVGELVLDYQTTSDQKYESDDEDSYVWTSSTDYFTTVTQDQLLSEYHVSVSPLLIVEIFLLGTGVVLIAIVIPSFMIMRLNPKQILLEQN